jgi:uncharacterized protein YegP (UPF0339 family)
LHFEIYRDGIRQFRWRLRASNGRIIADSGEGYWSKADCLYGINIVRQFAGSAPLQDLVA